MRAGRCSQRPTSLARSGAGLASKVFPFGPVAFETHGAKRPPGGHTCRPSQPGGSRHPESGKALIMLEASLDKKAQGVRVNPLNPLPLSPRPAPNPASLESPVSKTIAERARAGRATSATGQRRRHRRRGPGRSGERPAPPTRVRMLRTVSVIFCALPRVGL